MEQVRDDWGANKIFWGWCVCNNMCFARACVTKSASLTCIVPLRINLMAKRAGYSRTVSVFTDLADCSALAHVADAVWKSGTRSEDAEAFLKVCAAQGVANAACAEGVAAGHGRSLYALVGAIFRAALSK